MSLDCHDESFALYILIKLLECSPNWKDLSCEREYYFFSLSVCLFGEWGTKPLQV